MLLSIPEHAREVSPPRYWFVTVSNATIPNSSFIPKRVIMALATFVACSISFEAPVVMEWNTRSSATRPPVRGCNLVFQLFTAHQVVLIFIHLHRIAEGAGRTRDNGDLRNWSGMALQCCDECMADLVVGNDQFLFVGHDLILLLVSGDDNLNALLQIRLGDEIFFHHGRHGVLPR